MKSLRLFSLLALLAGPASLSAQDTVKREIKINRSPELITRQEIEARAPDVQDAYEVVTRLRPNWLNTRGPSSINLARTDVVVYVSEVRRGGPSALKDVNRLEIAEIRHLRGTDASMRFGLGHEQGAILVKLK
jgi:hypothetical protein